MDFDLRVPTRLVFFDIGQSLLVDFCLCASSRLVFFTLVSRCWWTFACALPLVLSFLHWSVAVGGLWLVRSHSSCLFYTGQSLLVDFCLCASTRLVFFDIGQSLLVDFGLCAPTRLVFFDIGQSLLVDFCLCASTRLVFFTLVSRCWWTLACALILVLSFFVLSFLTLVSRCWWTLACALILVLSFLTLVRRCWWTLSCALPLVLSFFVLSFSHWSTNLKKTRHCHIQLEENKTLSYTT